MKRDWQSDDHEKQLLWAAATSETLRVLEGKWKIVIIVQLCHKRLAKEPRHV